MSDGEDTPDMQQFGQQFGPFGQFNMPMQPRSQIEHGLGSGVIISPDGYIEDVIWMKMLPASHCCTMAEVSGWLLSVLLQVPV